MGAHRAGRLLTGRGDVLRAWTGPRAPLAGRDPRAQRIHPQCAGFELALEDRTALPVAIGHGSVDPVIPVQLGQQASRLLAEAGLQVTYRESPIGHGVDLRLLAELRPWLVAAIAARTTARAG